MPYVERSADGKIIGVRTAPGSNCTEEKPLSDHEVLDFLRNNLDNGVAEKLISQSDAGFIRILEDVIDLLIRKHIILFTELPEMAQRKIIERKKIREKIPSQNIIVEEIL